MKTSINVIVLVIFYYCEEISAFLSSSPSHFLNHQKNDCIFNNVRKTTTFMTVNLSSSNGDQEQKNENQEEEKKELNVKDITEMIDTTFVNACMQLSKGYVDVLKLFIVSVKSGYELGITPIELIKNVDSVSTKAAGRDLMGEEIELRNTWIEIIYFILNDTNWESKDLQSISIDKEIISSFQSELLRLRKQKEDGVETFNEIDNSSTKQIDDPIKSAIFTQSLRVIWYTLVVLEEEERCQTDFARQDAPMKPQIPGAFS